jgi:DNA-binding FadR family transcriptional regulator
VGVPLRSKNRRAIKLAEQLAQEIVADIERTGMAPGDRFPSEVVMAQARGVSRASLREALRILEVHGLIIIRPGPGGGPELAELTAQDFARTATLHFHRAGATFKQLLDARVVLEPRLAQLAAMKRSPEQVQALRVNLLEHEGAEDAEGLIHFAHEFHALVADMAGNGNQVLSLTTSSLHGIFDVYQREGRTVGAMRETVSVHRDIADAVEAGDADKAARLMEEHMQASAETFAHEHPTLIDRRVSWLSV